MLVQIAFASQAVEGKLAMMPRAEGGEGISPESLAMVRMVGAALFFQAAVLFRGRASPLGFGIHARLFGLAVLGVALNQALFLSGLRLSTPFVVSLLGSSIPVLTAALAILFRKESASWRTGLGLVLALSGVFWLTGLGSVSGADRGAVLVALNSLSYALYVVFSREVVRAVGALRFTAWVFTYGALLFAPLGALRLVESVPQLTSRGWSLVVYIVIVPTIIGYALNAWALKRSTATTVTIYIYLQPLVAAVVARIQLGYQVSSRAGIAALLILGGVGVTSLRPKRRHTMLAD